MAEAASLEALQVLYRDLTTVYELPEKDGIPPELAQALGVSLEVVGEAFKKLLEKPGRRKESRDAVLSGKIKIGADEWSVNKEFQEIALQVADDLDLDENLAAKLVLDSEGDEAALGRSLRECAIIRFHQQRKYLLSCIRLLIQISRDEMLPDEVTETFESYLSEYVLANLPGSNAQVNGARVKLGPKCISAMLGIRQWMAKLSEVITGAAVLGQAGSAEFKETVEFSRVSLIQQHELLAVILCYAVDKREIDEKDFTDFLQLLRKADKYDSFLVHLLPAVGACITVFGSTEGNLDIQQARRLNSIIMQHSDDDPRALNYIQAAIRAWWVAEYSGYYLEEFPGSALTEINIDEEVLERTKQFKEALKDGAFDFMLGMAADVRSPEWHDPARAGIRQWLQRKTPSLPTDTVPFSDFFQVCLMKQLGIFIEAAVGNMPDVLRKLRVEEDEQRQLGQLQEQDLDLERFLLIIAFSYEGRPEEADVFFEDPDNNLPGFLMWASKRASTPLVSAFCEMLQSLAGDEIRATCAHNFLLDESHQSTGKMRRASSLTWSQIFKELDFFASKLREKPTQTPASGFRPGKWNNEQAEAEPESAMMLECYLRLITKLATYSEQARIFLLEQPQNQLLEVIFQLISSPVPSRLRACGFHAVTALLSRKTLADGYTLWQYVESCLTGYFLPPSAQASRTAASGSGNMPPIHYMEMLFQEMSPRFEEASAFVQFLSALATLPDGYAPLNDTLPFQEDLGSNTRLRPGIDPYVDYSMGHIFAVRSAESQEPLHQRILKSSCLEFAITCLSTFNEDLIVFGNESNVKVDTAISSKDLATYVTLHPFARVMEWMLDTRFVKVLIDTICQDPAEVGNAAPDSPLIFSISRAIEVISKALDLQATYLDLVRPLVNPQAQANHRSNYMPTSNAAYASIEEGVRTRVDLVVTLGNFCSIGNPALTMLCLKLLEKISGSSRIISAWQSTSHQQHRNKAIVALEDNGDDEVIAGSFMAEFNTPLDVYRQAGSPSYVTKTYILDFLYACLKANPDSPTIAHSLLGFHCGTASISVESGSAFEERAALFQTLLGVFIEVPVKDDEGVMRQWLINLKYKVMRIFKVLWSSPLSASIVLNELRENDFVFHLLLQGLVIQPSSVYDGLQPAGPDFLVEPAAQGYIDFLTMRALALEYITHELCSVSQSHLPALKRRIFDALGGQMKFEGAEAIPIPSIFEFHDYLPQEDQFATSPPQLTIYRDLDLRSCLEEDDFGNRVYNPDKVQEILLLKRNETRLSSQIVTAQDADSTPMDIEEQTILAYVIYLNRLEQINACSLKVLKSWTRLLLVMTDANDFKGTSKVSFILQALQATLPSLEKYGSGNASAAYELAKVAKVLLFDLEFTSIAGPDQQSENVGSLISDKLFQLFQICLDAIARWTGGPELRAIYYSISYRYLTALVDHGQGLLLGRRKAAKTVQTFGERLINVICDDAYGGDTPCQISAFILLATLVILGKHESDNYVEETLNKLNFIGVLVDSLRTITDEWTEASQNGNQDLKSYHDAKLMLLLQLCQTRQGAKDVLNANLFRAIEISGLYSTDPELLVDSSNTKALESHYSLLVRLTRIISTAIISRGAHNLAQGRRFLTEHRMLVMHVLKRSAGIVASGGRADNKLEERIDELAEAFMLLITTTGFLEFEDAAPQTDKAQGPVLFH